MRSWRTYIGRHCKSGKKQIQDKYSISELEARGIKQERIRCYGFAFQGKKVLIG